MEEEYTQISIYPSTREKIRMAMIQVQARLERELTYDDFLKWALKELKLD